MNRTQHITEVIIQQGILPLYFHPDETVSVEVLRSIYKAGIKAVEYTSRGDSAFSNFKKMLEVRNNEMPGLALGVGTIKNITQALEYYNAGADFLVSPGFLPNVAGFSVSHDVFYAPGCMTPSEILIAENSGMKFIKLFPGNILGREFLTTIKDIFPKLMFMPTGGVDTSKENIESWFKAGVCAVGMGSKLISKKLMEAKDYATIESETKKVLQVIAEVKNS